MATRNLPVIVGRGLSNTLARRSIAQGYGYEVWNCTDERGQIQARPGFAIIQKLMSGSGDVYGMGYGRFNGIEEYMVIGKPATASAASVFVLTAESAWPHAVTTYGANAVAISDWQFAQFGPYLYGVNETDGLWRRKIGDTSGALVWQKVNTRFRYYVTGSVALDAQTERPWNATNDVESAYAVQSYSPTTSVINADGSWTLTQSSNRNNSIDSYAFWVAAISNNALATDASSTGVSFSVNRYWSLALTLEYDTSDVRPQENPIFRPNNVAFPAIAYISTSSSTSTPSTANFKNPWPSPWIAVPVKEAVIDRDSLMLTFDMDAAAVAGGITLDQIKKIAFGVNINAGNIYSVTASSAILGGVWLNQPNKASPMVRFPETSYAGQIKPLEYAVQYYNSTTTAESSASILTLPDFEGYGVPHPLGALPVGNRAKIVYTEGAGALAPANFDKLRIWRKRPSDGGRYYMVHEGLNADGAFIDSYVDAIGDFVPWPTAVTPRDSESDFESVDQALSPSTIAIWKGHVILGVGTEIYMSYGGTPDQFVPPARDLPEIFDVDDPTLGRTLYMSQDQSDRVLGAVADDLLYLIGLRGIYVMVGDSAIDATPPRLLPGSKGSFGKRSWTKWNGGVIAANEEGLYWHRGVRALAAGSDSIYEFENLTRDVERSWKRFTSDRAAVSNMVVREWHGEIICICDNRFMLRNRAGYWEEGEWDENAVSGVAYGGTGGAGDDGGGTPWADDPGAGADYPTGPYVDPNNPTTVPASPIHGVVTMGKVGLMPGGSDPRPGFDNPSWDVGLVPSASFVPVLRSGSEPSHRIVEAFGVEGRGLRVISRNGCFIQERYSEAGVAYANDAGYPIEWLYQTGDFEFAPPYRVGLQRLFVNAYAVVEGAQPLRVILTSLDGRSGFSQQYFDISGRTNYPDSKAIRPGSRWGIIISGRSSAVICERLELTFDDNDTKGT